MKMFFPQCIKCRLGLNCYEDGFNSCPKIEMAAAGLGVPYKQNEDKMVLGNIPFGVVMGLKHIIKKVEERGV